MYVFFVFHNDMKRKHIVAYSSIWLTTVIAIAAAGFAVWYFSDRKVFGDHDDKNRSYRPWNVRDNVYGTEGGV